MLRKLKKPLFFSAIVLVLLAALLLRQLQFSAVEEELRFFYGDYLVVKNGEFYLDYHRDTNNEEHFHFPDGEKRVYSLKNRFHKNELKEIGMEPGNFHVEMWLGEKALPVTAETTRIPVIITTEEEKIKGGGVWMLQKKIWGDWYVINGWGLKTAFGIEVKQGDERLSTFLVPKTVTQQLNHYDEKTDMPYNVERTIYPNGFPLEPGKYRLTMPFVCERKWLYKSVDFVVE